MAMRRMFEDIKVRFDNQGVYVERGSRENKIIKSELKVSVGGMYRIDTMTSKYDSPQKTKATEFLVLDQMACSPSGDWVEGKLTGGTDLFVGLKINSTEYFIAPNGDESPGVCGLAAPYPSLYREPLLLEPECYVLPGQNWEIMFRFGPDFMSHSDPKKYVLVHFAYILYDGTDAVIANKLLGMGIAVKPKNIDWFKREVVNKDARKEEEEAREEAQRMKSWFYRNITAKRMKKKEEAERKERLTFHRHGSHFEYEDEEE